MAHVSKFAQMKAGNGKVQILHELTLAKVVLPEEEASFLNAPETIKRISPERLSELAAAKLIVMNSEEDDALVEKMKLDLVSRFTGVDTLYLVVNDGCELQCTYCPFAKGRPGLTNMAMPESVAELAVKRWVQHLAQLPQSKTANLILYGGEPLQNWEVCEFATLLVRRLSASARVIIATSGHLLKPSMLQTISENGVEVCVSLDRISGAETHRIGIEGDSVGTHALAAIRSLVERGVTTYAAITLTDQSADEIVSIARYLRDLGVRQVGLNPLRGDVGSTQQKEDTAAYAMRYASILGNLYKALGCTEAFVGRRYDAFTNGNAFPSDCSYYGNQAVVLPNGDLTRCAFSREVEGSVRPADGLERYQEHVHQGMPWRRLPLWKADCQPCAAKGICGGGCAWDSHQRYGSAEEIDLVSCLATKRLFKSFCEDETQP